MEVITYKDAVMMVTRKVSKRGIILPERDPTPKLTKCDKDHVTKVTREGIPMEFNRYHCASESHFPNVYGRRIPVSMEIAPDFQVPTCPWCKGKLEKGGLPDVEGMAIHGNA